MNIYLALAMIPYGVLMLPVINHFNYVKPRNGMLVDRLIKFQLGTLCIQIFFLAIGAYMVFAA